MLATENSLNVFAGCEDLITSSELAKHLGYTVTEKNIRRLANWMRSMVVTHEVFGLELLRASDRKTRSLLALFFQGEEIFGNLRNFGQRMEASKPFEDCSVANFSDM